MKKKGALIFFFLVGLSVYLAFELLQAPPRPLSQYPFYLRVPPKQNLNQLLDTLYHQGLVKNPKFLRYFMIALGWDRKIHSGTYLFNEPQTLYQLARTLSRGKVAHFKITLPEGLAHWEIRDQLKKFITLDSLEWENLIHNPELRAQYALNAPSLEGFLFPDTYLIPYETSPREMIEIQLKRFWEVHKELSSATGPGLDSLKTIVLASIVQKETRAASEYKIIAGVFHNRLQKSWPLGADPTIRYYLRRLNGPLYKSELLDNNPYNSRTQLGLPPGPISNPGREALEAAISPEETSYMFFVAKDDGSGEHYFTKTNSEHNAYKIIRSKNRSERGRTSQGN